MSSGLGSLFGPIEEAIIIIEETVQAVAASQGQLPTPPTQDMAGVYGSFELLRGYFNHGAPVHHNQLVAITNSLRST